MTVKEMIEKLKAYPEDWPVIVWIEAEVLEDFEHPIVGIINDAGDSTKSVYILI